MTTPSMHACPDLTRGSEARPKPNQPPAVTELYFVFLVFFFTLAHPSSSSGAHDCMMIYDPRFRENDKFLVVLFTFRDRDMRLKKQT